ncbi:MAG: hypothetical protein WBO00_07945 [Steroidobacteraceae bacterium]
MPARFSIASLPMVLFRPKAVFEALAAAEPSAARVFFGFALWIGLLPGFLSSAVIARWMAVTYTHGRNGVMPAFRTSARS